MASKSVTELFLAEFPAIVKALTSQTPNMPEPEHAMNWFKEVLEYNVPHGKKNRGESVLTAYCHLVKNPTPENLKIAKILGWAIELFQAYFLVTDDIMDNSQTRRGQPCWYKQSHVGLRAVNDGLLLEAAIYRILRQTIRDKPYYQQVMELFLDTGFHTAIGQALDMISMPSDGSVDFTDFTLDRQSAIVKWKTSLYTCYMPIALSMYLAGITDEKTHENAKTIMIKMGYIYQVQDDYLDCYGDPKVIGKIGTDIQENKCGWLIINALMVASDSQKNILKENYGKWDEKCVKKVKDIFRDLDIEGIYRNFETNSYQELMDLIERLRGDLPKEVYMDFVNRLYKREK